MLSRIVRLTLGLIKPAPIDAKGAKNNAINQNIRQFLELSSLICIDDREQILIPEILIPCYNHGHCLDMALKSVAKSGIPITVIDDASTDNTAQRIEHLGSRYRFSILQNKENLLQGGSINRAIQESKANLFIILNADDAMVPYALDMLVNMFKSHPDIRMAGGSSIWFHNDETLRVADGIVNQLNYVPKVTIHQPEEALQFKSLNDINMTQSGCAFLRSAWKAVGGFLPFADRVCSHDDRDFQMRVAALFPVAIVDEPVAFYRLGQSTKKGQN